MKQLLRNLITGLGLALGAQASDASTIFLDDATGAIVQPSQTLGVNLLVNAGNNFTVTLKVDGLLTNTISLGNGLRVTFDPNVLSMNRLTVSNRFSTSTPPPDNVNGRGDTGALGFEGGTSGNIDIATISFHAITDGVSNLKLGALSTFFVGKDGGLVPYSPDSVDSVVTVLAAVPLPTSTCLFGCSLLIFTFIRKRTAQ